ncbi:hypothetical protein U1Q18_029437 [Sarracenia purpurea var. burkii]
MDLIEFVASYEVNGGGEQRGFSLVLDGDGDFPAIGVSLVAGLSRGDLPADGGSEAKQEGGPRSSSPWCGGLRRGGRSTMMLSATELGVGRGVCHPFISSLVTVKSLLYTVCPSVEREKGETALADGVAPVCDEEAVELGVATVQDGGGIDVALTIDDLLTNLKVWVRNPSLPPSRIQPSICRGISFIFKVSFNTKNLRDLWDRSGIFLPLLSCPTGFSVKSVEEFSIKGSGIELFDLLTQIS